MVYSSDIVVHRPELFKNVESGAAAFLAGFGPVLGQGLGSGLGLGLGVRVRVGVGVRVRG